MSAGRELFFCGKKSKKSKTYMATACVLDNDHGQLVLERDGSFVSARLPVGARLAQPDVVKLKQIFNRVAEARPLHAAR
jgi:hypothetical protein